MEIKMSKMTYVVISYIGDYPVEHQQCWDIEYPNLKAAIKAAKDQQRIMISNYPSLYTVVMKKNEDSIVEWIIHEKTIIKNDSKKATELADLLAKEE
jgi:hypothetical protein